MERKYVYRTSGTCSQMIEIRIDEDTVTGVQYFGGCSGNTQGISHLVGGMKSDDIIQALKGIRCGFKPTSCPDQLATALEMIKNGNINNNVIKEIKPE